MRARLTILCLIISLAGFSQSVVPLERIQNIYLEKYIVTDVKGIHTSVRPFIDNDFEGFVRLDSSLTTGCKQSGKGRSWFVRKMYFEHFLKADTGDFKIAADPLFDFQAGYDLNDHSFLYRNTRGLQILGKVGDKLAFYTNYLETQARFPSYINSYIDHFEVAPGSCRVKDFKGNAWDYGTATANISYSPLKQLNLQLGYGKNFFGNGYRSLLLSDNAFQYPFLKITTHLGRFEYVNLFTSFQNLDSDSVLDAPNIWYGGYQKKPGTFNYLSVNVAKWMQVGIFEGVLWESHGLKDRKFNINQFIPVILLNTIRYSLFSENNVVLGLNANSRPIKSVELYGQFVLDDFHLKKPAGIGYEKTKYGFQLGAKWFDVGGIDNLIIQAEYNQVRPYTYGHKDPLQSYTHNNQALAHPLGANFREVLCFVDYRFKRFYGELQFNFAMVGADSSGSHWGSDIFMSDTHAELGYNSVGNTTCQGVKENIINSGLRIGYLFNPKYHLCVEGGFWYRGVSGEYPNSKNFSLWLGLRTPLFNQYFDW
jgi:hypothetical protein